MKAIKTLSSEEIVAKYDITAAQMELWSCGKSPFVKVYGTRKNYKWRMEIPVYAETEVDAFFKKLGIKQRDNHKPIVSLTDAAVILGIKYHVAKKLVSLDERFKKLIIDINYKHYSFKRTDILDYKKNIFDKEGVPKPKKKEAIKPLSFDFNAMAVAFISQPSEIRPRREACANAVTKTVKVRYQDWV